MWKLSQHIPLKRQTGAVINLHFSDELPFTCQVAPDLSPVTEAHVQQLTPSLKIPYQGRPVPLRSRYGNLIPPKTNIIVLPWHGVGRGAGLGVRGGRKLPTLSLLDWGSPPSWRRALTTFGFLCLTARAPRQHNTPIPAPPLPATYNHRIAGLHRAL